MIGKRSGLPGVLALLLSMAPASAVTIANGSFEDGIDAPTNVNYRSLLAPADFNDIDGWTVAGAGVDWINTYWIASDGIRSLDLSAFDAGSIEQTIAGLDVGTRYRVSFDMAGNNDGGATIKELIAAAVGEVTFSFDVTGTSNTNMNWETKSFEFVAVDTSQLLKFTSLESSAFGAALDNVSISAVPLPAALPLLGAGLAALGLTGWRRRRQANPT